MKLVTVHPTAIVEDGAEIGPGTKVWHFSQVRGGARVGADCILGKGVYVGAGVRIGDRVKIQNGASVYEGVTLEDGVFVGPHVCFTNDRHPRAINSDGSLKTGHDWEISPILVRTGASVGASAVLIAGITVGRWALIAAGSVVTRDVPDHGLVAGNPARLLGHVCTCARRLRGAGAGRLECPADGSVYRIDSDGKVSAA